MIYISTVKKIDPTIGCNIDLLDRYIHLPAIDDSMHISAISTTATLLCR